MATVEVSESGGERVVKIEGDPDHPVTSGFLCFRTSRFVDLQQGAAPPGMLPRLRGPLLRKGRDLEPVSWDEALSVAADRLRRFRDESGPASIFHYRSGGSLGILKTLSDRFFEELGPCATKTGDICSGAGESAQEEDFGVSESSDLETLLESRHIVLWGKNPTVSNVHLVPLLKKARSQGAKVWLIDPVHHKGVGLADEVISPCPGGDLDLALGVALRLVERGGWDPQAADRCENLLEFEALVRGRSAADYASAAGVDVEVLDRLAEAFQNGPTSIQVGWGMQRRQHGAAIVRALDALSAVSGNLYLAGGGCSFYFGRRTGFASLAQGEAVAPRTIREPMLGQDVLAAKDPGIRCIWVTAGNPVAMLPDAANVARAFEQTEFTIVVDPFLTDTGRRADLVLPAPTLLEDSDLVGAYGHHYVAESRPVVEPPADVWHEVEILQDLAGRLGLDGFPQGSIDELKRELLAPMAAEGVDLERLRAEGEPPPRNPLAARVLFGDGVVKTPSGRVRLMTSRPERHVPASELADGERGSEPLWLFSNSTRESQASLWSGRGLGDRTWVAVHSEVLAGLDGVTEGGDVIVESVAGSLVARLVVDDAQRPDVAIMPKGGHFDRGHSANALVPAQPTDEGLGAAYLDCKVRLRPLPS